MAPSLRGWAGVGETISVTQNAHRSDGREVGAILGGRLTRELLEDAVEVRERLEADFIGDFADAQVGVEEKVLGLLNADAGEVVGEVDAGRLLEHLAEVEGARVDRLGDHAQGEVLLVVLLDEVLGAGDHRRLGVGGADHDLVAHHAEVVGKDVEQVERGLVPLGWEHGRVEVGRVQLLARLHDAPFSGELGGAVELRLGRLAAEDLAGLEIADGLVTSADRDR